MRFLEDSCNPDNLSPLTLAFVGDGIYELLVREHLACLANRPTGELSTLKVKLVNAGAQTAAYAIISTLLSEKEQEIFKRGRNAHTSHIPKNASHAQYPCATGMEALFGWLYLSGRSQRAAELFKIIIKNIQI